jgi:signal transduction histidine kinase
MTKYKIRLNEILIFGFLFGIFVMAIFNIYSNYIYSDIRKNIASSTEVLKSSYELSLYLDSSFYLVNNYLFTGSSAELEMDRTKLTDYIYRFDHCLEVLRGHGTNLYLIDLLDYYSQRGFKASYDLINFHDSHKLTGDEHKAELTEDELLQLSILKDSQAKVVETISQIKDTAELEFEKSMRLAKNLEIMLYLFLFLSICLCIYSAVIISQSLSVSIGKIKHVAVEIGKGNMNITADVKSVHELEELADALDSMRKEIIDYQAELESEFIKEMTERKQTVEAYEKLKQLDKLKDEFLSEVSHELRTPLTNIKAYNQILYDGIQGEVNEKQKTSLKIVLECTDNLIRIINNLLDLSKYEAKMATFHLDNADIKSTVNSVVDEFKPNLDKLNAQINITFSEGLPLIMIDNEKIKEVLRNLIGNSIKYKSDLPLRILVDVSKKDSQWLAVSIKDNGIGIPENKISGLFNKFFQVEQQMTKKIEGTGLGLSIVKHIIEGHNGKVEAKSIFGQGSEFIFYLPLTGETNKEVIKSQAT